VLHYFLARRRRWCFRSRQIDSLVVPAGRGTLSPLIAVSSVKNGRILWRLRSSESLGRSRREFLRLSNLTKVCPLVPPSRESVIRLDDREGRELGPLLQFPLRLFKARLVARLHATAQSLPAKKSLPPSEEVRKTLPPYITRWPEDVRTRLSTRELRNRGTKVLLGADCRTVR